METQVNEMFSTRTENIEKKLESMAVFITVEDEAIKQAQKTLNERKNTLEQLKADLAGLMQQNGIEKISLANGLSPKATITRKYYKQSGVSDEQLFDWLKTNGLDDIIKPHVHFNTLQATLQQFTGEIPDMIFNISNVPSITMYGKAKFLEKKGNAETSPA